MKVAAIIQARMGSTRLPGKVMLPILGEPMIHHVVRRVARMHNIDALVVAVPDTDAEAPIVDCLRDFPGVIVSRGSENDVLSRYYDAAKAVAADVVMRITSDCPLISPAVSSRIVQAFLDADGSCDYASNALVRTYPRGLDTEVFSFAALDRANRESKDAAEREHVTNYITRHADASAVIDVVGEEDLSDHRWTVDTPEDFELIQRIYEALYPANPAFETADVLDLLAANPDWLDINRHVRQKRVE